MPRATKLDKAIRYVRTQIHEWSDPDRDKILELRRDIEKIDFSNWINAMTKRLIEYGPVDDIPQSDYEYFYGLDRELQEFGFFAVLGALHEIMWEHHSLTQKLIEAGIAEVDEDDAQ